MRSTRKSRSNNPENDARLVAQTLQALGFEVDEHLNLTGRDFKRVLREFARRMDDDQSRASTTPATACRSTGATTCCRSTSNLRDQDEVKDESIDIEERCSARIDRVRPRARIVILDACRNNPFAGETRSIRVGQRAGGDGRRGTLIAFASAPGRRRRGRARPAATASTPPPRPGDAHARASRSRRC